MGDLRQIFLQSEPLLLFMVIGIGYLIGKIRYRGFSLGIAAVLFVGLFFGGWQPRGAQPLVIAKEVSEVGLVLFVYVVGLTSGAGFFDSFRRRGLRFNLAIVLALLCGALFTFAVGLLMRLPFGQIAGVFCGSMTNTPALAALTESITRSGVSNPADAAVGYSVAYPFGVICGIVFFNYFFRIYRDMPRERRAAAEAAARTPKLTVRNFEITNPALFNRAIGELAVRQKAGVMISRIRHGERVFVPNKYTILQNGDVVVAVGTPDDIEKAKDYFGAESDEHLEVYRSEIDMRRILVSSRDVVGKTIGELGLDRKFSAQITRLRRADVEIVAAPEMTLEIGDRLIVVMPVENSEAVAKFFGDSVRGLAEIDYTALTLGISLGVIVGMIPIPMPGGNTFSLGFAGGPLIVGLILGRISRSGPFVWSIPLEVSQALSHVGLLFFLAGVGVRAGGAFFSALSTTGWKLFLLGAGTTSISTLISLFLVYYFAHGTAVQAMGATSGMQTQPATLACAHDLSKSSETYIAYATTYPVAMIGKIILAQLIFIIGQGLIKF